MRMRNGWAKVALASGLVAGLWAQAASAAEGLWIQIEAKRDLPAAEARARDWAGAFPGVAGFRLASGWYGLALGPYDAERAAAELAALKSAGRIPADSYVVPGEAYGAPFWTGAPTTALPAALPAAPPAAAAPLPPRPETPAEARRAEQALPPEARAEVQAALDWAGFAAGAADGAYGPATRNAMAAWQTARGAEATGVLTSPQREAALAPYRAAIAALGLTEVTDGPAGIVARLPMGLLEPARHMPPFVRYEPKADSGVRLLLVSSPVISDYGMIAGMLPTLLPGAEITRDETALTARLAGPETQGEARVELRDGLVKGWVLSWPAARAKAVAPALVALRESFRPLPGRALDPTHAAQTEADRQALRQGLEVRRPVRSRSGLKLGGGHVVTTLEAVADCRSVTADGTPAEVRARDAGQGIAILRTGVDGPGPVFAIRAEAGDVVVSGYSTGPSMAAPALARARAAAPDGGRSRLAARLFPGDGGAPVFDRAGQVAGLVLAPARGEPPVALSAPALRGAIEAAGLAVPTNGAAPALTPDRLSQTARAATVRILCWD